MNFLAHFVVAMRSLTPIEPAPAYVVGTALPDLLPLAVEHVRLRQAHLSRLTARSEFDTALNAGVSMHLATDAVFHKSQAFEAVQAEMKGILADAEFEGIRVRRFFVAHVLAELVLDAVLLRDDSTLADHFYTHFALADFDAITAWAETATGKPLPRLPGVLRRFSQSQYLRQYGSNNGVASGLAQLCRRARQDTFEGANFMRLIEVVSQAEERIRAYVPALLSETVQGVLVSAQNVVSPR